jgi:hypothetical protein
MRQMARNILLSESSSLVSAQWRPGANVGINEDNTQGTYFSRSRRLSEAHLTLNGRNIPLVNSVKYVGVIFDKKVTWRLHIEMIEV